MKQVYLLPARCMGCEECVEACAKTHDWESRAYVEVVDGFFPVPMRCNHCQDAPCRSVCPTEAIKRAASGAVLVDESRCIGCGACAIVCPFGVPTVSARTGKVLKCDLCEELVFAGEKPVCVTSCPKGALEFGDRDEPMHGRRQRLARQVRNAFLP
jgi:anaerobic carbon-monoxide dehydrogenase iron sulfur subunit